jgi:3-hydroxyethyl bacteriochlorophyllide a dehydrogenase
MTTAVVFRAPQELELRRLELTAPTAGQVVVDIEWSGISTGTERLLWSGTMPPFPGLGYPLVPGYESVGRVVQAGEGVALSVGTRVFVPGANCFGEVKGLFGGAAARLVVPAARVVPVDESLGERAVLLALAATAHHALANGALPELIIGHGVLGRLLARIAVAKGVTPTVWELNPIRASGAVGYQVSTPDADPRIPSIVGIYPTCDWHERETWDFFGIVFEGHPALTRIAMPDDWPGHPQRKDYPLGGIPVEYKGATTPPPDQRRSYN